MSKFLDLSKYIKQQNMFAEEKMTSFIANASLQISGKSKTVDGLVAAYKSYQAVYEIEDFHGNADRLLAHFASWISKHGQSDNEEQQLPTFDIEQVNDHVVDVIVEVDFEEPIELVKDAEGEFEFHGDMYKLANVQIVEAETFELDATIKDQVQ